MKIAFDMVMLVVLIHGSVLAVDPTGQASFEHPLIKDHGGIVVLPEADQQPKPNSKILLDITSDKKSGSVILGLDRAALILNQYTQAGAGKENGFKMALVLHGSATSAALSQEAYAKHAEPYMKDKEKSKNVNLELLRKLKRAGVEVYVCGQALAHHGFAVDEVATEVKVAVSAATVSINLQMDNYAYIPFH